MSDVRLDSFETNMQCTTILCITHPDPITLRTWKFRDELVTCTTESK